jgi:hypothetical protein
MHANTAGKEYAGWNWEHLRLAPVIDNEAFAKEQFQFRWKLETPLVSDLLDPRDRE